MDLQSDGSFRLTFCSGCVNVIMPKSKLTVDDVLRIAFEQNKSGALICDNCSTVIGEAKSKEEAKTLMERHWETCPMKPSFSEKVQGEMK